ncbi:NADH-quinone oxidoreductase subunit I [bacterium]|nr:NADH-quinone oxidoreductase subunit I [bacterium]
MKLGMAAEVFKNMFKKPITVRFPAESIPIAEGYRGEHDYDINKCISCGLCARICPNKAIEMVEAPKKYKNKYKKTYPKIDLGKCCFCGLCQDICPPGALKLTKNLFPATSDPGTVIKYPMPKDNEESWNEKN